jgi:hypothetical protein
VASGWSESVPLPSRDGLLVRSALQEMQTLMPLPLPGLDVDNETAFMNEDLVGWCAEAAKPVTNALRRCSSNPIRLTFWKKIGGTRPPW